MVWCLLLFVLHSMYSLGTKSKHLIIGTIICLFKTLDVSWLSHSQTDSSHQSQPELSDGYWNQSDVL